MNGQWTFADDLGPAKIIHMHDHAAGLEAILVVDNVARGPAIGGSRMAPDVTLEECFRLARSMTMKNAAAGLPHGGGKSVIAANPKMPLADKERLVRAFALAIGDVTDYVVGPDMGTNEQCMAWVHDEIGRAVGLPREIGGIPLDEIGATGYGLAECADVAQAHCGVTLDGARVAIQGFGSVGRHGARFLAAKGARIVAVSDSRGAVHAADGLDVEALIEHKASHGGVADFDGAADIERDRLVEVDCEVLVPGARPDVITAENVERVKARLIVPGANIPATAEAEQRLHEREVLMVPDFIANAGGVICASVEYHGGTETQAFAAMAEKIRANTDEVLVRARERGCTPRAAAVAMAGDRVRAAMRTRRFHQ